MNGSGFFSEVFAPIENIMSVALNLLYQLTEKFEIPSYGLAIILLTMLIKLLVYPLTRRQIKSMLAMQKLQPQMKKLQEKYKNNPKLMQQELMKLYKTEGTNPLSGCLPMLIQMPILMGMYYSLFNFDYGGASPSFLWVPNLSEKDPTYLLPILSTLSTFLQQKIMTREKNTQTLIMMIVMPSFIGWISLNFPAGLVLYWITANLLQIVMQWWINKSEIKSSKEAI